MSSHPAYPTAAELEAERAAELRDAGDLLGLRQLHLVIEAAIDRAVLVGELRHPTVRYAVSDTREALRDELKSIIAAEREIERELIVGGEDE